MPTPCPQPRPVTTSFVPAGAAGGAQRAQRTAAMSHRLLTKTGQGIASRRRLHRLSSGLCRFVERVDRARLAGRIGAAEQRLRVAANRPTEVVALRPVRTRISDRYPLARVSPNELEPGLARVPRPADADNAVRADSLEPLSQRQVERAVELPQHVVRKDERACHTDVDVRRAEHLPGADDDRLARKEAGAAHAVAADVHEGSAGKRRIETHVAGIDRERERRAHQAQLSDGSAMDDLEELRRLWMVAPH